MRIVARQHYAHEWSAQDEDTLGDPTAPIGLGNSADEAIDDLMDQLEQHCCGHGLRSIGEIIEPIVAQAKGGIQ